MLSGKKYFLHRQVLVLVLLLQQITSKLHLLIYRIHDEKILTDGPVQSGMLSPRMNVINRPREIIQPEKEKRQHSIHFSAHLKSK